MYLADRRAGATMTFTVLASLIAVLSWLFYLPIAAGARPTPFEVSVCVTIALMTTCSFCASVWHKVD